MNANQLISMFTRLVARRAMTWGINKGLGTLSRGKTGSGKTGFGKAGFGKSGLGKRRSDAQMQDLARKMRTLSRLTRR
ncbi:MAG: hypothetical protein GY848_10430 [Methyloversatilis sp.]|jgi:hypothetical protein|uniref:hypothetical protein n=1 Tax=Paracoccus TaxID=265 RepID=UPI001891CC2E|nr:MULTISPECIES: hypothetical protein [Paracoccus]MBF5079746.1 hypothetical protein [Paracoccus sp. NBH48]MCP4636875.1 hypothetical protein [Methyloversatilis sp.]QXI64757.1 hypothetical protein CP157_02532 [Paracoccus marcusii]